MESLDGQETEDEHGLELLSHCSSISWIQRFLEVEKGDSPTETMTSTILPVAHSSPSIDGDTPRTITCSPPRSLESALQAVAFEESMESTQALLSAARAVFHERNPVVFVPPTEVTTSTPASPPTCVLAPPEGFCQQEPPRGEPVLLKDNSTDSSHLPDEEKPRTRSYSPRFSKPQPSSSSESSQDSCESGRQSRRSRSTSRHSRRSRHTHSSPGTSSGRSSTIRKFGPSRRPSRRRSKPLMHTPSRSSLRSTVERRPKSARSGSSSRLVSSPNLTRRFTVSQLKLLELADLPAEKSPATTSRRGSVLTARLDELSKPSPPRRPSSSSGSARIARRLATYALLEEAKECTFRPRLTSRRCEDPRDDAEQDDDARGRGKGARSAFVDRQHATERSRRRELETTRSKREYDAHLDRKCCPGCGVYQSYDEYVEKRKSCPNCKLEYVSKVAWRRRAKEFFRRQEEFQQNKERSKGEMLRKEQDEMATYEKKVYLHETGTIEVVRTQKLRWEDVKDQFLERNEAYSRKRRERMLQADDNSASPVVKHERHGGGSDSEDSYY